MSGGPDPAIGSGPGRRGARILVVDDEPAITVALSRKLRREGHECVTAGSAEEALRRLSGERPDLVVSDVRMPGMTGLELLQETKRQDPDTQFIIMTGYSEIGFAVEALRRNADDYLLKPFDLAELDHTIARALEHRRLLRENRAFREAVGPAEPGASADGAGGWPSHLEQLSAVAGVVETRDGYNRAHPARVMRYACAIAEAVGIEGAELRAVQLGALLHDIGKMAVPEHILNRTGSLKEDGWARVREHPAAGARWLDGVDGLSEARRVLLYHHERWDGDGYPAGLGGEEIPLAARIVAVADAYDAMNSDRPYRPSLGRERAMAELRAGASVQFDGELVEAFLESEGPALFGAPSR